MRLADGIGVVPKRWKREWRNIERAVVWEYYIFTSCYVGFSRREGNGERNRG